MTNRDDELEKGTYSVCVVQPPVNQESRYRKFFPVADIRPGESTELVHSSFYSVAKDANGGRPYRQAHLYNPIMASRYDSRDSDFYVFHWGIGIDDKGRYETEAWGVEDFFTNGKELKEVIIPYGINNEEELRDALREGIPFDGKTTRIFYLVFRETASHLLAARCERKEFSFRDGLMKLPPRLTDLAAHALAVPIVRLDPGRIIESESGTHSTTKIYGDLRELESKENVLLRPLDDYASDYVRWFISQEGIDRLTKAERQNARTIIENALKRPDALEQYLDADVPEKEVLALRNAVTACADSENDASRKLIVDALLRDASIYDACMKEVEARNADALKKINEQTASAAKELTGIQKQVQDTQAELVGAKSEYDLVSSQTEEKRIELESLSSKTRSVIEELEAGAAEKLGLVPATMSKSNVTTGLPTLVVQDGRDIEELAEIATPFEALASNMSKLGIACLVGDSDEQRKFSAAVICAALSVTQALAIPNPIAAPIADALAAALYGRTATRVRVPSDFRDVDALLGVVPAEDKVVLFSNVIDPVNEGVLFALLESKYSGIAIFSFTSHASAQLLAKEAWDSMFFPPTESLCCMPGPKRRNGKMRHAKMPFSQSDMDRDSILYAVRSLIGELEGIELPSDSFLLPGMVLSAFDDMPESERYSALSAVAQHLGVVTGLENDAYDVLLTKSERDLGLMELAKRMGKHDMQ